LKDSPEYYHITVYSVLITYRCYMGKKSRTRIFCATFASNCLWTYRLYRCIW